MYPGVNIYCFENSRICECSQHYCLCKIEKTCLFFYFPGFMIIKITFSFMFRVRNMSTVVLFSQYSSLTAFLQTPMWNGIEFEVGSFSCKNCQQDSPVSYLAFLKESSIYIGSIYSLSVLKFPMLKPLGCFKHIWNLAETWQRMTFLEEGRALVFWRGLWEFGSMKTLALVKKDTRWV